MASCDDVPEGAQLAASLIAGLRHLLIDRGVWDQVRSTLVDREPDAMGWIENELAVDPTKTDWVSATHYGDLMDTLLDVVGSDRAFALGRERLHRSAQAGAFSPVVRSWMRSFGDNPEEFLRLSSHAWAGQTRNFGVLVPVESRPGHARFVIPEAPPLIRDSEGWQRFLAGYGTGLLDLVHREGLCVVSMDPSGQHLEIVFDYDCAGAGPSRPAA